MEIPDKLSCALKTSPKPLKTRKSFLHRLFHRKKGIACLSGNDETDASISDSDTAEQSALMSPNNNVNNCIVENQTTGDDGHLSHMEDLIPVLPPHFATPSLSRDSQFDSSDSIKRAKELFLDPLILRPCDQSESDSGFPDEEKKADADSENEETFVKISSHTFRQLQNEVTFLREQLVYLQQLFYSGYEVSSYEQGSGKVALFSSPFQPIAEVCSTKEGLAETCSIGIPEKEVTSA